MHPTESYARGPARRRLVTAPRKAALDLIAIVARVLGAQGFANMARAVLSNLLTFGRQPPPEAPLLGIEMDCRLLLLLPCGEDNIDITLRRQFVPPGADACVTPEHLYATLCGPN